TRPSQHGPVLGPVNTGPPSSNLSGLDPTPVSSSRSSTPLDGSMSNESPAAPYVIDICPLRPMIFLFAVPIATVGRHFRGQIIREAVPAQKYTHACATIELPIE